MAGNSSLAAPLGAALKGPLGAALKGPLEAALEAAPMASRVAARMAGLMSSVKASLMPSLMASLMASLNLSPVARFAPALLLAAAALTLPAPRAAAQVLEKSSLREGSAAVPIEIARPEGRGPWPPLLYIHARRGYEADDREHVRALARQGFLVLAPDWQAAQMIERWPDRHVPESEDDVEAALAALRARPDVCAQPVGIVAKSRGPYFAIRLAARRPADVGPIVAWYGHFQNPNAPEPQQLFGIAPEVMQLRSPVLMLIGDADFELRRIVGGRAFYALWERGVPVELQMYPMARRAFDFRADQSPEEKIAARHAAGRERDWLARWMGLDANGRCTGAVPAPGGR